jgi:hypothetical protein
MIGDIPLHVVLLALSLDGRLQKDKPQLLQVNNTIEIYPPKPFVIKRNIIPTKTKKIFFLEED